MMLDHIGISVSNYEKSRDFYRIVLAPLGYQLLLEVAGFAGFGQAEQGGAIAAFWLHQADNPGNKTHIAFAAKNRQMVDAFYAAALSAGGVDNGKPGIREIYHPNYYGAFVLDPDGYNIEAVCHHADNLQSAADKNSCIGVKPEDILAPGQDSAEFHGVNVRKGTIKAAIENVKILESIHASIAEKQAAKETLTQLVPQIKALELLNHVSWNNPEIAAMFEN